MKGYPDAVKAVGEGKAQAMILDQPVGEFYVEEFGYKGKVAAVGKPVASGEMTLPVRKDDTVLLAILQKGIEMVGEAEFEGISRRTRAPEALSGAARRRRSDVAHVSLPAVQTPCASRSSSSARWTRTRSGTWPPPAQPSRRRPGRAPGWWCSPSTF